jgi:hypothetical protein
MKKSITAALLTVITSTTFSLMATAEDSQPQRDWVAGVGYLNLTEDLNGERVSLGALIGSLGYKIAISDSFYLIPELRVGMGARGDSLSAYYADDYYRMESTFDIDIDSLIAFSLRGQIELNRGMYLYVAPTYSRGSFSYKNTWVDQYFDEDEPYVQVSNDNDSPDDIAVRAGIGFNFSNTASAEIDFEKFEGSDLIALSFRYNF